jgi:hypothetical protein
LLQIPISWVRGVIGISRFVRKLEIINGGFVTLDLIPYIAPYLYIMVAIAILKNMGLENNQLLFCCLIPAFFVVVLRGQVGTDTASYLRIIDNIAANIENSDVEIGFELVAKLLLGLGFSSQAVVAAFSWLICALLIIAFSKTKDEVLIFVFLIFPIFFYDMTMNGLRYGIAFCFAKIAFNAIEEGKRKTFALMGLASVSFHLSGFILLVLLMARRFNFRYLMIGGVLATVLVFIFLDRLIFKFTVYGDLQAPNGLSGLAPLLLVILLYISTILTSLKDVKYLTFLLILETAFFLMAKFSYAGLRFQYLTLFAFLCILPRCAVMRSPDRAIFLALYLLLEY